MSDPAMKGPVRETVALLNDHLYGGGTERVLSYLSSSLFAEGDGLIVVFDDSRKGFDYRGRIVSLAVAAPPYGSMLQEILSLLTAWVRLRRAKRRHDIQVCISQKEGPNFINILSGGFRRVVTVHEHKSSGIRYTGFMRRLVGLMIRTLYGRADCIVAVSKGVAHDLEHNFGVEPARLKVIYNPCDFETIAARGLEPLDAEHEMLFEGPTLITAGRLVTQKGQWHLIRAFVRVRERIGAARLLIIGTGDHLAYLTELAIKLGIADAVTFLGYQENPFKFMRRADVFVLTSLWEGLGAILQEAMACGIPVVSSDCPSGPRELLAPELDPDETCAGVTIASFGMLTPRVDGIYRSAADSLTPAETCFADAVVRLLEDKALRERYRSRGLDRIRAFGLTEYAHQWRELLDGL
jgi:glycosyltransferase involved in cell wall biosynthesis